MDTFSHILIAFLLLGKFDIKLAIFAGVMALILDLDFILAPLAKKFPILEHRGLVHSIPGLFVVTLVAAMIFSIITNMNYLLSLGAGLIGAFTHTLGDTLTTYSTFSLWPYKKQPVKLDIIIGIDPLTIVVSLTTFPLLYWSYENSNFPLFDTVYLIAAIFFIAYFLLRILLKVILHFKFHTISLPIFNFFKYKIVYNKYFDQNGLKWREIKWQYYNLITKHFSNENSFNYPVFNPLPPLDSDLKLIAYSHNLALQNRIIAHAEYHLYEIVKRIENGLVIFWYALELATSKNGLGIIVTLKRDGTHKEKNIYPYFSRHSFIG